MAAPFDEAADLRDADVDAGEERLVFSPKARNQRIGVFLRPLGCVVDKGLDAAHGTLVGLGVVQMLVRSQVVQLLAPSVGPDPAFAGDAEPIVAVGWQKPLNPSAGPVGALVHPEVVGVDEGKGVALLVDIERPRVPRQVYLAGDASPPDLLFGWRAGSRCALI